MREQAVGMLLAVAGTVDFAELQLLPAVAHLREKLHLPEPGERGNAACCHDGRGAQLRWALATESHLCASIARAATFFDHVSFPVAVRNATNPSLAVSTVAAATTSNASTMLEPTAEAKSKALRSERKAVDLRHYVKAFKVRALAAAPWRISIFIDVDSQPCYPDFAASLVRVVGTADIALAQVIDRDARFPVDDARHWTRSSPKCAKGAVCFDAHNSACVVLNMSSPRTRLLLHHYERAFERAPIPMQHDQPALGEALHTLALPGEASSRFGVIQHVDLQPELFCRQRTLPAHGAAAGVCNAECALVHKPLGCIGCSKRYHPPLNNTTYIGAEAAHVSSCLASVQREVAGRWIPMGTHPHHTFCNQAHVLPRLRAVYIENQKAGSRSIISALRKLEHGTPNTKTYRLPYAGYEHEGSARCSRDGLPSEAANFTVFTFVRRPLDTFISGFSETMGRVVTMKSKDDWGGGSAPAYFGLGCNDTDRYFTTFVGDVLGRRPLGLPTFHIFPQAVKTGVFLGTGHRQGFDFIGAVEHLEEHLGLLLERLGVADARIRAHEVLGNKNDATTNIDRCNRPIRPTPQEVRAMHKTICSLLSGDYRCLGAFYNGTCAEHAEEIARKLEAPSPLTPRMGEAQRSGAPATNVHGVPAAPKSKAVRRHVSF